jgi:SAM-dependent methyltransferase
MSSTAHRRVVDTGTVSDSPHPSARYDDHAHRYAAAFQDETLRMFPVDRNMIHMVIDLVDDSPRVLDAGCGAGQVSKLLQNWGCDAVGVDAAEQLIALARTAYPTIAFTIGDLRALPYPDGDFDALVARYCVIHTAPADMPTVIAEFARVLRPGGGLLVEFQSSGGSPTRRLDHAVQPAWAGNTDEFADLLGQAGFLERARLSCPEQPDLRYARTPETHLVFRKRGPRLGTEPLPER